MSMNSSASSGLPVAERPRSSGSSPASSRLREATCCCGSGGSRARLLETWHEHALSVVLVTHDVEEAVYLCDRVAVMTARPSQIKETLAIDLPRPRDQLATRGAPRFIELRHHLYGEVRRQPAGARR